MSLSRNGRKIVYTNETPFETDVLYSNLFNMVNASYLASAILGYPNSNATLVSGLPCTQNTSPNMSVLIGSGVMFNFQEMDATAYSSVPSDTATTDKLFKPYIQTTQWNTSDNTARGNLIGLPLTFTAPGSGTTNYLLQATFLTTDTDVTNRPYFNPLDREHAIYQTAPETRWDTIYYSLKSATSPTIPTPDAGYVGLYVIAIPSGTTQILNSNISVYSGAPFITESLTQKVSYTSLQALKPLFGLDTGSANAYVMTATPAYTQLVAGTTAWVKIANTNTGASTLNVSGLGAVSVQLVTSAGLSPLVGGELKSGMIAQFQYDGSVWQLQNPVSDTSMPIGAMLDFAGTVAPSDFLLCDGTAYSRTTYAALLSAISFAQSGTLNTTTTITGLSSTSNMYVGQPLEGTNIPASTTVASIINSTSITISNAATGSGASTLTFFNWGNGDGSTTFNVPDYSRCVSIGSGGAAISGPGIVVGQYGGEETHTLSTSEVPNLNVTVSDTETTGNGTPTASGLVTVNTGAAVGSHTFTSTGSTTNGGGGAHNIMQPSNVAMKIIKFR